MSESSEGIHPLVWSAGFIAVTLLLAQGCRMGASRTQRGMIRSLLLEGIAAAELCASCFELIIGRTRNPVTPSFLINRKSLNSITNNCTYLFNKYYVNKFYVLTIIV